MPTALIMIEIQRLHLRLSPSKKLDISNRPALIAFTPIIRKVDFDRPSLPPFGRFFFIICDYPPLVLLSVPSLVHKYFPVFHRPEIAFSIFVLSSMYSDLDTGLSQQQLAKAIITTRKLAEIFIERYMARHRAGRREAIRRLAEWNIDLNRLPKKPDPIHPLRAACRNRY